MTVSNSVEYNMSSKGEYKLIIKTLKDFINSKNVSFSENENWVKNDNKYFLYPYLDLMNIEKVNGKIEYIPTLLSITPSTDNNEHIAKIGWFKIDKTNEISMLIIYNLIVVKGENGYLLKNILEHNTTNWKEYKVGNIKYLVTPFHKFEMLDAIEFNKINTELASYFEIGKISFTYFLSNSNRELMQILGYDFADTMFFSNQNGSITYPHDNLIFSGNNSEVNRHELVHLYTNQKFKNKNNIIDEGVATFFGGSKGIDYANHLIKLKNHLKHNHINLHEELFLNNYVLDETTSLRYTLGAFLCDLTLKKGGEKLLFELLNSGKTDADLIKFVQNTFKVGDTDLNNFLTNELLK